MPWRGLARALTLLALGLATWQATSAPAPASGPATNATLPSPARPGRPFLLGINEGVSVPRRRLEGGMPPEALARHLEDAARHVSALGARLIRAHTGAFPRTSMLELRPETVAEGDLWVRTVQATGLEPILMVSPWPANRTALHTPRYLPEDMVAYEAYVRARVERYDGDGVDDMPGLLAPVRAWEVDNEPDLKFTRPPRTPHSPRPRPSTGNTGFCPPEEYAAVLVASARAIRAASADARVLGLGLYAPDRATDYMDAVLAVPGAREAIDVVSLHTYANDGGERLAQAIRATRARLPDVPVWVTETSASSARDPARQARLVVALTAQAAEAGAEALLWHTLADPPAATVDAGAAGGLASNSLTTHADDGTLVEKPSARTYRTLAAVLRDHDLTGARGEAPGLTRLTDGSALLWDGALHAPKGGIDLRDGSALPEGARATAPAWLR